MEWYWIVLIVIGSLAGWFGLSAIFYRQFFKRFYDLVLSLLALIILFPLLLLLTVIGSIVMKGNPFFVQQRPGKINPKTGKEKIFSIIKFRTMTNAKDKEGNLLPDVQRLTKYGRFLRSTSLDEILEFVSIVFADMSIVGPRPLLVSYLGFYTDEERQRHYVRPGLTGLAQINGRNCVNWNERLALDVQYVKNLSLLTDVRIILKTIVKVFKRDGIAVDSETVEPYLDKEREKTNNNGIE